MKRIALLAAVFALATACTETDSEPAWLRTCVDAEPAQRANDCKTACGADQLCPGTTDQDACEVECRRCTPDTAWCPAE